MRRRRQGPTAGRGTLALGALALSAVGAVIVVEVTRVRRKGESDALGDVVVETAEVARTGYKEAPTRENAMFNLLTSFVTAFVAARAITTLLRSRPSVGPFRDLRVGRRHIHHFVPGIVLAFVSGAAAIVTRDEDLEPRLAVPFGIGMGLTLDESALLLELDDVYWSEEGILSVQIALAVSALLAAVALGGRLLWRGEQAVLEPALS